MAVTERPPRAPQAPLSNTTPEDIAGKTNRPLIFAMWAAIVAFVVFVAANARTGAVADRIEAPGDDGAPRPVEPLFGFDHWIPPGP